MLAPLTKQQSHQDGTLSDDEYRWLTMRAAGGFGTVMTCASHVHPLGQGFPGQLGCFSDDHLPGLTRLARGLKEHGALALVQLHHAGRRSPQELIHAAPVAPGEDPSVGARALTTAEVESVIEDFVSAAVRCERAGFDGVQLHGAHDYLLCEFLNVELNQRSDHYGGSRENRLRIFFDIIDGIRAQCRPDFHLSVRLSPELFGLATPDVIDAFERLCGDGRLDQIDMSLWNVVKPANDDSYKGARLIDMFAGLDRGTTRLSVAGKIYSAAEAQGALDAGADIVDIGRAAITNHDFARRALDDPTFVMRELPVTADTLRAEGLGESFIAYMNTWRDFVAH
jgi:2,4-dienoyl-CoA reductase-like NADH-dependent reductase (Old Yellow Enzyme family)